MRTQIHGDRKSQVEKEQKMKPVKHGTSRQAALTMTVPLRIMNKTHHQDMQHCGQRHGQLGNVRESHLTWRD